VVRVALATGKDRIRVGSNATWRLAFNQKAREPNAIPAGETWTFSHGGGTSIRVQDAAGADRGTFSETFLLYPDRRGAVMTLDGRAYHGYFVVVARSSGLVLVNRLRLEDYVRGVVGNEIGKGGDGLLEALKAQAVAARTYAYLKVDDEDGDPFDVRATEMDQVYGGVAAQSPMTERACADTRGEIIHFNGVPVAAFYSSNCGGRTAGAGEVWNGSAPKYLQSVHDRKNRRTDDWCKGSKYYRWEVRWEASRFMEIFAKNYPRFHPWDGKPFGSLKNLRVVKRGKSGRVTILEVETTNGRYRIQRDTIRWTLRRPDRGEPALLSTYIDVDVDGRGGKAARVKISGRGYGHGVGMCQVGAMAMSRQGESYRDILTHYYHDVEIRHSY